MGNLFLHFLNRELLRSVAQSPPRNYFEPQLKTLIVASNGVLFTNFANIIEGNYLASSFFKELIATDLLKFYAERNTLEEFWESSANRYSFDKERYPYLKKSFQGSTTPKPYLVRNFSMTHRLKSCLFELNGNPQEKYGLIKSISEGKEFWKTVKLLVKHKGEEAITMSLAEQLSENPKPNSRVIINNLIGRLLSILYLKEIIKPIYADIATGISGLYFFDQISKNFPIYDIPLLSDILHACCFNLSDFSSEEVIIYKNSRDHYFNASFISAILSSLYSLHIDHLNSDKRSVISQHLINAQKTEVFVSQKLKLKDLSLQLWGLFHNLCKNVPQFREEFHKTQMVKSILILSATSKETTSILEKAKSILSENPQPFIKGSHAVLLLGVMRGYQIWHGQCEAGSVGPSCAQAIATDLIDALKPSCILMPGIAFGLNEEEQKIGNILVSTHVFLYEKERAGEIPIPRGELVPASPKLLSVLRIVEQNWKNSKMHFGILMSGEKLVDDPQLVAKLKGIQPEAIGGEMEGAGLYSAAYRRGVDWIIFKSIVDWGHNKTNQFQENSSYLSSEVLFETLKILTTE